MMNGMTIKERADNAIKQIDAMSRDEFEKKLHEVGYYPQRLDESADEYWARMAHIETMEPVINAPTYDHVWEGNYE